MKINRMLEITTVLLNRGTITAGELAKRFEVSTRTIYRDVEALSSAGVPVYMSKGNGGGISLMENYTLPKTLLSEQESESLLLALSTLKAVKYPEIDTVLEKMGTLFKNNSMRDWVEIDFVHWGSAPNEHNKFVDIKRAIIERRVIEFEYVNADGMRTSRFAEPIKLMFKGNAWYLAAFCRRRNELRIFRISRVKNVRLTAETFVPPVVSEEDKQENRGKLKPFVLLKLRFDEKVLNRLYDNFDDSLIVKRGDHYDVEIALPEDEWLYGYLMSFGSLMEVIEPQSIRSILAVRFKEALNVYE